MNEVETRMRLKLNLIDLKQRIQEVGWDRGQMREWFHAPSGYLRRIHGLKTPVQAIRERKIKAAIGALEGIRNGVIL